jgi:hypothetical protein
VPQICRISFFLPSFLLLAALLRLGLFSGAVADLDLVLDLGHHKQDKLRERRNKCADAAAEEAQKTKQGEWAKYRHILRINVRTQFHRIL